MRQYRYVWLLLSLVVCLILSPIAERTAMGSVLIALLFTLVTLAIVNAASRSRTDFVIALTLSTLWLPIDWLYLEFAQIWLRIVAAVLLMTLIFVSIYGVLKELSHVKESNFNILCAAVAAYLLIGVGWELIYDLMKYLSPESFDDLTWSDFIYFSLTTLTTVGYGDITPGTSLAGIVAALEAVLGQLYVAVLIARLVGLLRS
jgi:voltage-gated potassium channel